MSTRASAWLAWSLWVACVVLIALALLLYFLTDHYPYPNSTYRLWSGGRLDPGPAVLTGALSLVYPFIGSLIVSRLPTNPIGWTFCAVGLIYAVRRFAVAYADYALLDNFALPWGEYAAWFSTWIGFAGLVLAGVFLVLLFPDGRLPSRRWRIAACTVVCGTALTALGDAFYPGILPTHNYVDNPLGWVGVIGGRFTSYFLLATSSRIGVTLLMVSTLAALSSLILRLYRARGDERQQLKWFMYAAVPATVGLSVFSLGLIVTIHSDSQNQPFRAEYLPWLSNRVYYQVDYAIRCIAMFGLLALPVFTYIAILRYRLYDIDIIINRTLVYGALTATVVAIYVLLVGTLGAVFRARGDLGVSLVAAGAVAVVFAPLRERLQRAVNRLMYGERDDPYAVLSRLGRRLEATVAPEAALTTIVETIAQALKVPYAAIAINRDGEGFTTVAEHGTPKEGRTVLPLVYQRENIGRLIVAPRAPGETFSPADGRLLEDLARQVEVAVHAYRLTADLQRSRHRLVSAREEERRRLRRDLHDGLGPTLGALTLGLDTTRLALAQDDPKAVDGLLLELKAQTQEAVSDVRRLVYGLRPPALDDLGLVPAIRQQAANRGILAEELPNGKAVEPAGKNGLVFTVEASDDLPALPAAVEVACYRIAQEAITNAARHSGAGSCLVSLSVDVAAGTLELKVADDGIGISGDRRAGVGMSSMRERAEELGGTLTVGALREGGTRVLATLPLPATGVEE